MPDFIIGLDLGQASDPTALAVLRRSMLLTAGGLPVRDHRRQPRFRFDCLHLERYPLGTGYPHVVEMVKALIERAELQPRPRLAIDATGVGRAVVDLFLDARLAAVLHPVTLTGGATVHCERWNRSIAIGYWVPKNETIGVTQALLQTGRLRIAKGLPLAETLRKELLDFRKKVSATGHESFNAREGAHDDVLLAVSIACWLGEQPQCHYNPTEATDTGRLALDEEQRREIEGAKIEAETEKEARQREWMSPNNPALWNRIF
jgi:hypothetical protein